MVDVDWALTDCNVASITNARCLSFCLWLQVKGAMKRAPKSARELLRCLNARQFGLKLIANVTYGYTAAGFSGRLSVDGDRIMLTISRH